MTPELEAKQEYEERIRDLLKAYQETLETVEDLPAVVRVLLDRKVPGSYCRVPYLRWFLKVLRRTPHRDRSLNTPNRRFYAIAAVSGDSHANRTNRETVKLYLQSLPRLPYRILIFGAVLAPRVVIALPLQGFRNIFYVLDLIGALLRSDVTYVSRAFEEKQLGPTVRSLIVLLIGFIVVVALITSPFGLKRILFDLYPWTRERLDRGQGPRFQGRRPLRPGRQRFRRGRHPGSQ